MPSVGGSESSLPVVCRWVAVGSHCMLSVGGSCVNDVLLEFLYSSLSFILKTIL